MKRPHHYVPQINCIHKKHHLDYITHETYPTSPNTYKQQQTPHTHPTHTHVYALPYKRHTPHKVDNWTCNYQQSNTYTPTKQATSTGTYTSYYHLLTQENKDWKEFTSSIQLVPIPNKLKFT